MVSLECAYQNLLLSKNSERKGAAKLPRLVADPTITPRAVSRVFGSFAIHKNSTDVWALVAPPAGAPQRFGFKSGVSGDWLCKTLPLLFELLDVCPNTKLLSRTVTKALRILVEEKSMIVTPGHSLSDVVDKINIAVRVLLWWLRQIKHDGQLYSRVTRMCSASDKVKIDMVLNKVQVPSCFEDEPEVGEASTEANSCVTDTPGVTCLVPCTALVPYTKMDLKVTLRIFSSINETLAGEPLARENKTVKESVRTDEDLLRAALSFAPLNSSADAKPKPVKKGAAKETKAKSKPTAKETKAKSKPAMRKSQASKLLNIFVILHFVFYLYARTLCFLVRLKKKCAKSRPTTRWKRNPTVLARLSSTPTNPTSVV